jgi:hypothetical protein
VRALKKFLVGGLTLALASCGAPSGVPRPISSISFAISPGPTAEEVTVTGEFTGVDDAFPELATLTAEPPPRGCAKRCSLRYTIAPRTVIAREIPQEAQTVLLPFGHLLAFPRAPVGTPVTVTIAPETPLRCALPPRTFPVEKGYETGFCLFGPQEERALDKPSEDVTLHAPRGRLTAEKTTWATHALDGVARFYQGPMVRPGGAEKLDLFVWTARRRSGGGDAVLFGEVHSLAGASIALYLREDREPSGDDWVLPHELVHLGMPSLPADGRALMEGVATFYEPQIRCASGDLEEAVLYRHLAQGLRRGADALRQDRQNDSRGWGDIGSLYWGGAALVARLDEEVRQMGKLSSFRDVLAADHSRGHDATELNTTPQLLERWSSYAGSDLRQIYETFAQGAQGKHATVALSMTPFLTRFGLRGDGTVMDESPRARAARMTLCPRGPRDAAPGKFAGGHE